MKLPPQGRHQHQQAGRRGFSLTESIVACGLVGALCVMVVPALARTRLLDRQLTEHRLAWDELHNQMERLYATPSNQLEQAMKELRPDPEIAQRLAGITLRAVSAASTYGQRIELTITWSGRPAESPPLALIAWRQRDLRQGESLP